MNTVLMSRLPTPASSSRATTGTRRQILQTALIDAAEALIATDGLGALRARTLAERVGCSVGAIYTIFPDLAGIVLAVNGRTLAAIDGAMTAATPGTLPQTHLVHLAAAYLDYAAAYRLRWAALFQHTLPKGDSLPDWYETLQSSAFSHIEAPLARLCPALPLPDLALLARSLFAAVHGIVALGLDEKLAALPLPQLHAQVATIVTATAAGLATQRRGGEGGR